MCINISTCIREKLLLFISVKYYQINILVAIKIWGFNFWAIEHTVWFFVDVCFGLSTKDIKNVCTTEFHIL